MNLRTALLLAVTAANAQSPQNPSPMTDSTRAHKRVNEQSVPGTRLQLSSGSLLLPPGKHRAALPLVIHFHGDPWLAEWSVRKRAPGAAVIAVQIGSGSGVYARAFSDPGRFASFLTEARTAANVRFHPVVLTSFSAGYGAIREILRDHDNWPGIDGVLLMDSLHTGYTGGALPGPLDTEPLRPFLEFARSKLLLLTHSEVFPGTFASTTETADYLISQLGAKRTAVLRWGPLGMQQLSHARSGHFELLGFAGNSAPDHVDHFHAMSEWLRRFRIH